MISIEQVRAARKLLGWSQLTLSLEAGISHRALIDFETRAGRSRLKTISLIQRALETAGVEFTSEALTGARLSETAQHPSARQPRR
jgi:transcriptional regulator with XRE-family HTH domain